MSTEYLHEFLARERPELSPGAKLALLFQWTALERTGWVLPTVDLARCLGCAPRQTKRYLAELNKSGDLPRGMYRWLAKLPVDERLAAAIPLSATYSERTAA